ncbi:fimbrial protein [Myxococcus sp. K15C18031901]|uniref:type IV pilin protein n=1 Tax=Myxococcus dinghuensis TaxID=2906761 RepID=UPI0020A7BECA|nr:fimbrial protein [Myxococcus dinghuensis]MCP3098605.1 fimbrial protein [Myxococcus dinghuensis]
MPKMTCPRCKNPIDLQGVAAGATVACQTCGNIATATKPLSRKWIAAIIGAVALVLCCPLTGIMAAIAIPNFIRFQLRAKQAECKTYLKSWYLAQQAYRAQHDRYEPRFAEVGFAPEPGNRYAYFAAKPVPGEDTGTFIDADPKRFPPLTPDALPPAAAAVVGLSGTCPDCEITAACVGDLVKGDSFDVWVISTGALPLTGEDGEPTPPGQPVHLEKDLQH